MSTIIAIILILIVVTVLGINWFKEKAQKPSRLAFSESDYDLKQNDKKIIVEGPTYSDVKSACSDFCDQYNSMDYLVILKLIRINPNTTYIIFPYDIEFKHICYLVNYLEFPINQQYAAKVTGWLAGKKKYDWLGDPYENKKIMIYNSFDLTYSDCVLITTADQETQRINFSSNQNELETHPTERQFKICELDIEELLLTRGEFIVGKE